MAYLSAFVPSDPRALPLTGYAGLSTVPVTLILGTFVASGPVDVQGFRAVDWSLLLTTQGTGPITRIDAKWEYAETLVPAAKDWAPLQVETIAAGISTPATYIVQQGSLAAVPSTCAWTTEVRGRWMRILVQSGAGVATNSVISLSYLRRA